MTKKLVIPALICFVIIGVIATVPKNTAYQIGDEYILLKDNLYNRYNKNGQLIETGGFLKQNNKIYLKNTPFLIDTSTNTITNQSTNQVTSIKKISERTINAAFAKSYSKHIKKKAKSTISSKIKQLKNKNLFELYIMYLEEIVLSTTPPMR